MSVVRIFAGGTHCSEWRLLNGQPGWGSPEPHRGAITAATHVDNPSRVQAVTRESNPLLAELLSEVSARTDVPCLINISFNVTGEPIVCSPKDAVECFLGTDIDYLVLGDFLVSKR